MFLYIHWVLTIAVVESKRTDRVEIVVLDEQHGFWTTVCGLLSSLSLLGCITFCPPSNPGGQ